MTKHNYNIKLDIPLDADSVRYFIPKGYTARIEDGVLIIEPKESEDERIRKIITLALIASEEELSDFYSVHNITRKKCTDWLERQKEDKHVWSEEDKKMVETICKEGDLKPSEQRWLKSLKNRGNSPKSNSNSPWKPSEEQMRAFHELLGGKVPRAPELYELYNDLEKLM